LVAVQNSGAGPEDRCPSRSPKIGKMTIDLKPEKAAAAQPGRKTA
jgi:hypothetical protein